MREPFYGVVNGMTVGLHDLRNAQLLREDVLLLSDASSAVTDERRAFAEWYLAQPSEPASPPAEEVLGLLRAPPPASARE